MEPDTELGFGGYGMTAIEFVALLERLHARFGVKIEGAWPHTIRALVGHVASASAEESKDFNDCPSAAFP